MDARAPGAFDRTDGRRSSPSKTWRRYLMGLGMCAACQRPAELPVRVLFGEDSPSLNRANNASLVLAPDGDAFYFSVDGTDFGLSTELSPDATVRTLELYLAEDEKLLGWGTSAPFTLDGGDMGLTIFVGEAGKLSTFPALAISDPQLLTARAPGRGILWVDQEGATSLLNHYTYEVENGSRLDDGPAAGDGGLFSNRDDSILRISWNTALDAWNYDPSNDAWTTRIIQGAEEAGARTGAAALQNPINGHVFVIGGGDSHDIVEIDLQADDDGVLPASLVQDVSLDSPRQGATALWLGRGDALDAGLLVFGGSDPRQPIALDAGQLLASGPEETWTGASCTQLHPASAGETVEVLCFGGIRANAATADAVLLKLPSEGRPEVVPMDKLLPTPMGDPAVFRDRSAMYAQSSGQLVRITRVDLEVTQFATAAQRETGGSSVMLTSGVTFLFGGAASDGGPADRVYVFTPAVTQ